MRSRCVPLWRLFQGRLSPRGSRAYGLVGAHWAGMHRAFNINDHRQVVIGENYLAALQIKSPNRSPIANVGGPYTGAKKKPVTFDGT